MIYFKKV